MAFDVIRRLIMGTEVLEKQRERLDALIAAHDNQSELLNRHFEAVIAGIANQSELLNRRLGSLAEAISPQSDLMNRMEALIERMSIAANGPLPHTPDGFQRPPSAQSSGLLSAMRQRPLLIADRTYNTSHPDYDARLVRNFPSRIFNDDPECPNVAFQALRRRAEEHEVPDESWGPVLAEMLEEAKSVPGAEQVFERRQFVVQYMAEISRKYRAHYVPGWVNLDDALFLYWLVRQAKPRTIVQTGVCNGLSAAFMMLALAKNGPQGTLGGIDLPPVFNPSDPAWTVEGKVYGVVIPEGKTTGWLVPDQYRERFRVWNGDATKLLPKLVDEIDSIDLFYHDSDHTYDHMMFEFRETKRKLTKGGLIVGDDIAWNGSVWDFADEYRAPAYNFKGAVGVAFF